MNGIVNFYQNVFKKRSHIISPLNDLAIAIETAKKKGSKKKIIKFHMQQKHIDAFNMQSFSQLWLH